MNERENQKQVDEIHEKPVRKRHRDPAYYREWRRKNPEKDAAIRARYYANRARKLAEAVGGETNGGE